MRLACTAAVALLLAACRPDSARLAIGDPPAAPGSGQPHLAQGPNASAVLSWIERDDNGARLVYATLSDRRWQPPTTVATGERWFVNWADFPSVVPMDDTLWAAHWLVKRPGGTYAYDVAVALSGDAGKTWRAPLTPHTDGTATEHGFVTLYRDGDDVGALWLDGREMLPASGHGDGSMTLRGATITPAGELASGHLLDHRVCECCQTDVAMAASGPVVVYRNRSEDEVRDVYAARRVGGAWEPGTAVSNDGWRIDGCPVNGPAIAASGDRVAVAWFTAADDVTRVRAAVSTDSGATFGPAVDIDANQPVGRVDVELLDDGAVVISWISRRDGGLGAIMARTLRADGSLSAAHEIAGTSAARGSGFPQMLRHDGGLLFAWTDASTDPGRVRATWVAAGTLR